MDYTASREDVLKAARIPKFRILSTTIERPTAKPRGFTHPLVIRI
jgi:hypothetical protein